MPDGRFSSLAIMTLDLVKEVGALSGQPGLLGACFLSRLKDAQKENAELAAACCRQRADGIGSAAPGGQRGEQVPGYPVIPYAHPMPRLSIRALMSSRMVAPIWSMSRIKSGQ
jgi:hypothetical protein